MDSGLVLTTQIGTPLDPRNIHRDLVGVCKWAGIGRWHPHELRHSAASIMLAQGVPIEVVPDILGHSSIWMTYQLGIVVRVGCAFADYGQTGNGFKPMAVADDVAEMELEKVDSGTEILDQVSGTIWQKTVLTSCVLAGCLALIAVLATF